MADEHEKRGAGEMSGLIAIGKHAQNMMSPKKQRTETSGAGSSGRTRRRDGEHGRAGRIVGSGRRPPRVRGGIPPRRLRRRARARPEVPLEVLSGGE